MLEFSPILLLFSNFSYLFSIPKNCSNLKFHCPLEVLHLEKLEKTFFQVGKKLFYMENIFLTFPIFSCGKMGKKIFQLGKIFFHVEQFFFQPGKIFFPIFPSATLLMDNEISNQNNFLGLRKDRKQLEKLHVSPFSCDFQRNILFNPISVMKHHVFLYLCKNKIKTFDILVESKQVRRNWNSGGSTFFQ